MLSPTANAPAPSGPPLYAFKDGLGFVHGPYSSQAYTWSEALRLKAPGGTSAVYVCDQEGDPLVMAAPPPLPAPAAPPAPTVVTVSVPPQPARVPDSPALDRLRSNQVGAERKDRAHVVARQERQHQALYDQFRISMGPTTVAAGEEVMDIGRENFAISRKRLENQGRTVDNLRQIGDIVAKEQRIDVLDVRLRDLRMDPVTGGVYRDVPGFGPGRQVGIEATGIMSLLGGTALSSVFMGAGAHYCKLPVAVRAAHFNEALGHWTDTEDNKGTPATVKLRTRLGRLTADPKDDRVGRAIFAAVGVNYTAWDTNRVATVAANVLENATWVTENVPHGSALYNPASATLRANALFHAEKIVNLSAGDTFKGGLVIRADDTGGGSIRGDFAIWRNDCYNLIIITKGVGNIFRITHKGQITEEIVAKAMEGAVAKVNTFLDAFAEDWGLLRRTPIASIDLYGERYTDVPSAIKALARAGQIGEGVARDATVEAILGAWKIEPGQTAADLLNAVTRFAGGLRPKELVPVMVSASKGADIEEHVGNVLMPDMVKFARRAAA